MHVIFQCMLRFAGRKKGNDVLWILRMAICVKD